MLFSGVWYLKFKDDSFLAPQKKQANTQPLTPIPILIKKTLYYDTIN